MKLQFDASQDYQLAAVQAVVDVFAGQPLAAEPGGAQAGDSAGPDHAGNRLLLSSEQLLTNLRRVQARHGLPESAALAPTPFEQDGQPGRIALNLTVEMETGTGKTYVYLRTIRELHRQYGFRKFVIVVPSVAIREGVLKNLRVTHEHFQALYGRVPMQFGVYESGRLGALRSFATGDALHVLVLNIDAFTKEDNIINTRRESGERPIADLQRTRPIVIVDEPQNLETAVRRAALARLNPLALLRYSATHRNLYDLVYSLNPVQAYDRGLVKHIVVDGLRGGSEGGDGSADYNAAFVELRAIVPGRRALGARLAFFQNGKQQGSGKAGGVGKVEKTLAPGADLGELSGGREAYWNGFVLEEIDAAAGTVRFSGGLVLGVGEGRGGLTDEVLRFQVARTVAHHFQRLRQLRPRGIKVLSLFFIDRVASYRGLDAAGRPALGKLGVWLEEAVRDCAGRPEYAGLLPYAAARVHAGYFSQDRKGPKDTSGTTRADDDTYNLILRDKERLLSLEEPVQFLFSHSALREGWDNPNVFQICTLSEAKTTLRKRQEIGRGLRLPVDAAGQRVRDPALNVLTVVANESYESFARALQAEIEEETSVSFAGRLRDARELVTLRLRHDELTSENYPLFFDIWDRINPQTRYRVSYDTAELIERAAASLRDLSRMPPSARPQLRSAAASLHLSRATGVTAAPQAPPEPAGAAATGVISATSGAPTPLGAAPPYLIPDVYAYLQPRLNLTRRTLFEILRQSGRAAELEINPQQFLDNAAQVIQATLNELLAAGVRYERLAGQQHELALFEAQEHSPAYLTDVYELKQHPEKTLYNYVPVATEAERRFAAACEADAAVKFFFRLPAGFAVPTPAGTYTPAWAVVHETDRRRYFVVGAGGTENLAVRCARRHFELFAEEGVAFRVGAAESLALGGVV